MPARSEPIPRRAPGRWLSIGWRFARPHTIVGTSLSVFGLATLAVAAAPTPRLAPAALLLTWLACLATNIYIVGLNQLTDVNLDRLNKPALPLAGGELSVGQGRLITGAALALAISVAAFLGSDLLALVLISAAIGTAYSLPPLRLKRFHAWAAACIFGVRGVAVNLFLYRHFASQIGAPRSIPSHVWALTAFIVGLSLVIAWLKDIPDMHGDRRFRIRTLSLQLGPERVFRLGLFVLAGCYLGVIAAGIAGLPGVSGGVLALTHAAALAYLGIRSRGVDPANGPEAARFYQTVWRLFFLEYILFPIAALGSQVPLYTA